MGKFLNEIISMKSVKRLFTLNLNHTKHTVCLSKNTYRMPQFLEITVTVISNF